MKIKQLFLTVIISSLIGFLAGITFGLIVGVKITNSSTEKEVVSSTVILDKIKDQAFLVTRTVVTEQEAVISIDQGSAWSNFWWGHEITADGLMQVDVGVDLANLTTDDITVDDDNKIISINLPKAEVYNSSLEGDIEVTTQSGILKKLLATDDNEDYNLAFDELSLQAEAAVEEDEELLNEAQVSALSTLQVLLSDTGYTVK
ncbi:DUF4230 domain-containing protein [Patescibacteria group bacterium]